MFGIFKKYKRLIGRDAANSFNRIAAFLTNFCSNESIKFDRPDEPSADNPPSISVDVDWLMSVCLPKVTSTGVLYSNGGVISTKSFGSTSDTVAEGDHTHTTDDLTDWDVATVDFLTYDDLADYLQESDFPNNFLSTCANGYSGVVTVVTGVTWNGTQLVFSRAQITFTNGIATQYSAIASQTVATVAYTP